MKKPQLLAVIGLLALLAIAGGVYAVRSFLSPQQTPAEQSQKRKVELPVNVIPVSDRPYVQIVPKPDGHNLEIVIKDVKKEADTAQYLIEYQTGEMLQGAEGEISLGSLPAMVEIFLGSCSAGGKCSYHEDVKGGNLRTEFSGGTDAYALKSDWRYFDNKAKETAFSSKDAKFQIESTTLTAQKYVIVFNSPGYPQGLEGTPVSDPYSLTTSAPMSGKGTLTMRANEEGQLKIKGWDGSKWHEFSGNVEGKMITAEVDLMEFYIVTK